MLVVTVGASVEPYVRFTRAPNASPACSTKAAVTPAPPLEIRRRLSTRRGAKPGADMRPTKNVGGPIMNVMRSRSMVASASSGLHFAMSEARIGSAPGISTALSSPDTCASGAGMRIASSGASSWALIITCVLYASPRCVWSAAFGAPLEPDVNSATARSLGRAADRVTGAPASSSFGSRALGPRTSSGGSHTRASSEPSMRSTSAGPAWWWIGAAIAPSRQHARYSTTASCQFGDCHATTSRRRTPAARRPPASAAIRPSSAVPSRRTPAESSTTRSPSARRAASVTTASSVGMSHGPPGAR